MSMYIHLTYLVNDYDEAISFFQEKLCFDLVEDTVLGKNKRWVRVKPKSDSAFCLVLAKASSQQQQSTVGKQAGNRVFLFLHTQNFDTDYGRMKKQKVRFLEKPRNEPYGKVVVFEDLYGNKWDLIELKKQK